MLFASEVAGKLFCVENARGGHFAAVTRRNLHTAITLTRADIYGDGRVGVVKYGATGAVRCVK